MNVLFVTTSFPRFPKDYAGSFIYRLGKYLSQSGVNITVVAPGDHNAPKNDMMENMNVFRVSYFFPSPFQKLCYNSGILSNLRNSHLAKLQLPLLFFSLLYAVARRLKESDVIHCHWLPTVWIVVLARVLIFSKVPIVFTNWGSDTRLFPKFLIKATLSQCSAVVSTAAETDAHLIDVGYRDFHQIMAPVDEEVFNIDSSSVEALREDLGIQRDEHVVSFISRLNYFKDPLTFIIACHYLKLKRTKFKALIAGEGDLYDECISRRDELGLENECLILGSRDDPEKLLGLSEVTVHISPVENTWANIIAEAMFIGCPVVMTKVGTTEETFTGGENCLLVPPGNPEKLAESIIKIFEDNKLSNRLKKGAKNLLVEKGKSKEVVVERLIKLYLSLGDSVT